MSTWSRERKEREERNKSMTRLRYEDTKVSTSINTNASE